MNSPYYAIEATRFLTVDRQRSARGVPCAALSWHAHISARGSAHSLLSSTDRVRQRGPSAVCFPACLVAQPGPTCGTSRSVSHGWFPHVGAWAQQGSTRLSAIVWVPSQNVRDLKSELNSSHSGGASSDLEPPRPPSPRLRDRLAAQVAVSCLAGRQAWPKHAGQPLKSGKRLAASGVLLLTSGVCLLTSGVFLLMQSP